MRILVTIEGLQPLRGTASPDADRAQAVAFNGWLELLRALAVLIEAPPSAAPACATPDVPVPAHRGEEGDTATEAAPGWSPRGEQGPCQLEEVTP